MNNVLTVGDLMSPPSICLRADTPVHEAERRLSEGRVTGAPVVDDDGRAVGVLSQHDLMRHESSRSSAGDAGHFYTDVEEYRDLAATRVDRSATKVAELMTRDVVAVDRATSARDAAALLRERRIHRLLVTETGVLVGVVTSLDLLAALEAPA
jgi:CBS domain-containing protein